MNSGVYLVAFFLVFPGPQNIQKRENEFYDRDDLKDDSDGRDNAAYSGNQVE